MMRLKRLNLDALDEMMTLIVCAIHHVHHFIR
jgi:hypothetical protein